MEGAKRFQHVQPQLTGNAIRWAEKGCGVVDVHGGQRVLHQRSGRTSEEAQAESPGVPAGTQGHIWVGKWAKWDEAVRAAEHQIFTETRCTIKSQIISADWITV